MHLYLELNAVKQSKVGWRNIQTTLTTIRDNPIELLKTVSGLMHDTVRAKYPYLI